MSITRWRFARPNKTSACQRARRLVLRSAVEQKVFELQRRNRDAILNIPARLSCILAAENDQEVVFQLLTQELTQAMQKLSDS